MKKLIPFHWMPGSWGLKGKSRERARIEYELEGYERDIALVELDATTPQFKDLAILEIKANHGKITDEEYDYARISVEHPDINSEDYQVAKIEVDYHHGKITAQERDKAIATARDQPYVCVVNSTYDATQGVEGMAFEFDWNQQWIDLLISKQYTGLSPDHIVQQWFEDVCRGVASEMNIPDLTAPPHLRRGAQKIRRDNTTDYL